MEALSEITRQIQNILAFGTIAEVNHEAVLVRININGRLTNWVSGPGIVGKNLRASNHLRVGTQCLVGCPAGDPANAVILTILNSNSLFTPSSDGAVDTVVWNDGTTVKYDTNSKTMTVHSMGDLVLTAAGAIRIKADGDLWLDGAKIHALEDS